MNHTLRSAVILKYSPSRTGPATRRLALRTDVTRRRREHRVLVTTSVSGDMRNRGVISGERAVDIRRVNGDPSVLWLEEPRLSESIGGPPRAR
jgi:hypothetical protein